ncbi:MAG: hypothetical protein ACC645_01765, partial [Pirellulales bacterium]
MSTPAASETRRPAETPAASHRTAAPSPVRAPTPPRPATPATPPEPTRPAARPRPPRRSLAEVLAAFMEEKNIRWGELVGGMLIVGGSIALVVSLREQLQSIPYFRFFIFSGVTTALFAVGLYTAHRWKLESTSRALLLISTLLVPLNFLAMAWLSGEGGFGFALASGSGALILFAVLVFHAARIIVPDGKTLTALGVVGNSALLLFLSRWVGRETEPGLVLGLGCLPVACHMAVLGTYLVRLLPQKALEERQVKGLFVFLGTVTFATLAAMGVLVFRTGRAAAVLEPAAPLVPLIAMPVVAGALVAMRRLANTQPAAGLRTGSMAVALTGLVAMLAAVAMAWPNPLGLILVALLNYTGFTFVAFRYRLPGIHGMALGCLGLAYLTGFHWIYGNLATSDGGPPGVVLRQALLSVQSGTVLVGLFVLLAVASDFLSRRWRDHGAWYAGGAGVVGLLSLLLVTYEGLHDTASPIVLRAMIVYAVYGIGCLVMNLRWRRPSVTYPGLGLTIGASLWAFAWFAPGLRAVWPAGLAAETLIMAAVAWWLRTRADLRGATETDTANAALCAQSPWRAFGVPLATTAEIVSWVATGLVVWHGWSQRLADPWSAWHPVTGICLGAAYLALLAATSGPYLGQLAGWMMAGSVVALVGRFTSGSPSANLEMSITLGLTATGTILASVATWIAQRLNLPAHRETVTEPGDAPWYASLATDWLHVGLGTAAFGGLIIGLSTTWSTSAVPHYCALLAAATCFLAAWGYRWEPLSWIGSGLVFTGLAHALVWTYPHLATHPWPTALMIHATIALLAGSLPGRWLGVERGSTTDPTVVATLDSHILKPVRESGVVSSFAAVPVLLGWFTDWAHALPTAIHLFWLAGIWILVAWVRRWRLLFAAGQMALAAGVLFATTSWLVDEPWVNGDARGLLEPWSLQAYGVALGLLSLAWVAVRLALRNNKTPNHLLHGDRWAIDRFVTLALVFAHLTLTAWCVLPGVGREWNLVPGSPSVTTPTPLELHATGGGAWAVVAVLAAALVGSLWSRWRNGEILAAFSLCVTGALLLAGGFADSTATASALRWTLGFAFVFLSATLWLRGRLCDVASSWRANILHDRQSVPSAIAFALIFTAVPVLALTVVALLLQVTGHTFTTVTGSMFARLPMSVSYLVPITLVVLGFVGHALREKSGEFAFSGGLIASGAVVGGYLLEARTIHPVVCVQWFTVASAVWAAAWLIVRQQLDVWREGPHDPRARFLMTFQLALPTVGNLGLLLLALTVLALWGKLPTGSFRAGGFVRETGSLLGWAAFALTAAAWACRRFLRNRPLRPEVVGLLGMGAIGLAACTVARIADARGLAEPWGYITLMMGWAMYALAVVSATWYVAAQKYPGREPPQSLLRSAAIWVRLPAILAVLLGLKGATAHDLALWSAAAIALASVSGAAMAVWRRREGWAFAAGLGANLAASILVIDQVPARGLEGWVNLLQANMLATGAIALLWLGVRRRLYGARELSLTAGPLLGIQVGAGILGQICLLAIPVALVLLDPAESGRDAAAIARPAGWLAWIVAFAATAWYAWQVARNPLLHVIALGLITLGVMAACTHPVEWSTFHL